MGAQIQVSTWAPNFGVQEDFQMTGDPMKDVFQTSYALQVMNASLKTMGVSEGFQSRLRNRSPSQKA